MANKMIGECDACPKTNVELKQHGSMVLCDTCYAAEVAVVAETKRINAVIEQSRHTDQNITIKADIWNAATTDFMTLKAAIDNDESIPADQKDFKLVQECETRIKHLNQVIFSEEAALNEKKSARHSWITQTTTFIGKLRADEREKYKKFDISYTPASALPKAVTGTTRTRKTSDPAKKISDAKKISWKPVDLYKAAQKYGVDAVLVQMTATARNITPEEAAKIVSDNLAAKGNVVKTAE